VVRANTVANVEVLGEINELRKRNAQLEAQVAELAPRPALEGLAGLDEEVSLKGTYFDDYDKRYTVWNVTTTWRKVFAYISPYLESYPAAYAVKEVLNSAMFAEYKHKGTHSSLDDQFFQTVGIQLKALGLVKIEYTETVNGTMGLFWSLTGAGERLMVETRAVRTKEIAITG
jgi:hypothetical protein